MTDPEAGKIHILSNATINKIAAGEVIERPASVVKELVENSLDAEATSIKVEITSDNSGITKIRISDDGYGMDADSALISFSRHATSKISKISDLYEISTMGFRGEALASIAAVSKVTMITKQRTLEPSPGTKIVIEGGDVVEQSPVSAPDGTSILVEKLFFNTPVRKKFLKSVKTEFTHIFRVVEEAALANSGISFQLLHNGKVSLSTGKSGSVLDTITYVYGTEYAKEMIPVKSLQTFMKVDGFCAPPSLDAPNSRKIIISVNNRPVYSLPLVQAVKRAYGTLLPRERYPVCFLNIRIDRKVVDVNVHPAKKEVRFSREKEITEEIVASVREALDSRNLLFSYGAGNKNIIRKVSVVDDTSQKPLFCVSSEDAVYNPYLGGGNKIPENRSDHSLAEYSTTDSRLRSSADTAESEEDDRKLPYMKVIGQVDDSYIVTQMRGSDEDEMVIIDQHAAHERIMYEIVCEKRTSGHISQELLVPSVIAFKPSESAALSENLQLLEEEGFFLEEFGKDTYALRAVPVILGKKAGTETLKDIVNDLLEGGRAQSLDILKEKISSTIACKAAIKAGTSLSVEQMERLVDQLSRTKNPYSCPHGRPTMISFSKSRLDSMFKRS
ncbi:DNA mismatch repair endonuclease MutL [Methanolacinia paynteri]|uniref:DNA mismatch repair endonuclease MutL n=1 Tax=Methanolacinia paynteri TaxID=230356 RepID=UPI00064F9E2F|nr:DNA mismatch repair endonuclease MutL [Methanolacinia paynteri]